MKNKIYIFITFILGSAQSGAQALKNLGKGIQDEITCSYLDNTGQIFVGHHSYYGDSISFSKWSPVTKIWTFINTVSNEEFPGNYGNVKCVAKNDSLFVSRTYLNITNRVGLFYISKSAVTLVGQFKSASPGVVKMIVVHNNILAMGGFDSIAGIANSVVCKNAVLFDGRYWKNTGYSNGTIYAAACTKDTALVLSANKVIKYIYPNTWQILTTLSTKFNSTYTSIISAPGNGYMLTKYNYDSLYFWNGANVVRKKIPVSLTGVRTGATNGGILICFSGFMYKYNYGTNTFTKFYHYYQHYGYDSSTSAVISNDTQLYFHHYQPMNYKNRLIGKIAEIDLDSAFAYNNDTIVVSVFWDRNKNIKKDAADTLLINNSYYVSNVTYGNYFYPNNGFYTEIVPDYNDIEYSLPNGSGTLGDTCLKLPFSGNVKSKNTNPGVTRDTVYFPLRRTSLYVKNLVLYNYTWSSARVEDTNRVSLNIFNRDCNQNPSSATLTVDLEPDTKFLFSKPAYTSISGNRVTFNLTNLYAYSDNIINLYVIYPTGKFNVKDKIKHYSKITTTFTEDTTDNVSVANVTITNSKDPNVKRSVPEGVITSQLKEIEYHIHFQNEGNDVARRVTIVDTLDTKIPVYEFQMMGSTHAYTTSIRGNVVTWVFDNINLAAKSVNEPASQGYIAFKAKINTKLKVGDSIRNRANIYFDYNSPIFTNFAVINLKDTSSHSGKVSYLTKNNNLLAFPNPSTQQFTLRNSGVTREEIVIYSMTGNAVWKGILEAKSEIQVVTRNWISGTYLVRGNSGAVVKVNVE